MIFHLTMDDYIKNLFMGLDKSMESDICVSRLEEFPFYEWITIHKGIDAMKVHCDDRVILFLTKMKKGASFGNHQHSDADEVCTIVYGILADHLTKELKVKGESLVYTRGVPHEPYAKTDNLFYVTFYK